MMVPGNGQNSCVENHQADADSRVNGNIEQVIVDGYQGALLHIGINQPEGVRHPQGNSRHPRGKDGPLQRLIGERGLVVERVDNGDVALERYQKGVELASVRRTFDRDREPGDDQVEAARTEVLDVGEQRVGIEADHRETGHEVGQQHAVHGHVGFREESGRQSDDDQRKAVATQADYGQDEESGWPTSRRSPLQGRRP